jgi:hypothetical protein
MGNGNKINHGTSELSHDFTTFWCPMIYLIPMSHDFSTFPCPMILLHYHVPWFTLFLCPMILLHSHVPCVVKSWDMRM